MSRSTALPLPMDPHIPLLKDTSEDMDERDAPRWDEEVGGRDEEFGGPEAREELEANLLWKLDKRMSILILIYILNYIDRNNAGAARLRGFEEDLGLKGQQFATVLSILYVGYISMQIPSNMFLNHIGKPSVYLPVCMMIWGFVSIMTGFATNFYGALLTRLILGIVEASFFPGALFLISKWYKHSELGFRTALLFCGNTISNAFGALIASAILDGMEGVLGRAAWRWLFYIEGSMTIIVALCAMFILPDFPETTKPGWLSEEEIRLARKRMEEDSDSSAEGVTQPRVSGLWLAIIDPNVWILTLVMSFEIVSSSFTAWFPTIAATLGYNTKVTLLLCAPPYVFTTVVAFLVSRHSDKTGERFYHIVLPYWGAILGFIIAMATMNTAWRYISLFLMAQSYAGMSVSFGWLSNTFPSPPAKRAVALALINSVSQLGNIAGSYVWQPVWGPTFKNSFIICMMAATCAIVFSFILRLRLTGMNMLLHRAERARGETTPGFRYLV